MRTISLRLDVDSDALLRTLCERLGATQTDVVRKALESLAGEGARTPGLLGLELGLPGFFAGSGADKAAGHSAAIKAKLAERQRDQRPALGGRAATRSSPRT